MAAVTLPDGRTVEVPPGLGPRGTAQYLRRLGVDPALVPEAPPDDRFQVPSTNPVEDALTAAGLYIAQRTPGVRQAVANLERPQGAAGFLGEAAVPAALSFLAPGSGLAGMAGQGLMSAGLEAANVNSTPASIATEGAFGAAGTAAGDFLGRVFRGAGNAIQAFRRAGILQNTDETLRTVANAAGGNAVVDRINRRAVTAAAARSFGVNATELTPDVLRNAADTLGQQFDALVPDVVVIPRQGFDAAVATMQPGTLGGRAARNIPAPGQPLDGRTFRALRAELSERARGFLGNSPNQADDLFDAIEQLDQAAEATLGPQYRAEFRALREQWKNLRIVESLPSVRTTEQVTAGQLSQVLGNATRGYGTSFGRDTGTVLPATQQLFDVTRSLTRDAAERIGNPGTAPTLAGLGGLTAVMGTLTGATPPSYALAAAGTALGSQAAGLAAVGGRAPTAGRAGAAAGRALADQLPNQEERPRGD
jgi:hypothetical protein